MFQYWFVSRFKVYCVLEILEVIEGNVYCIGVEEKGVG